MSVKRYNEKEMYSLSLSRLSERKPSNALLLRVQPSSAPVFMMPNFHSPGAALFGAPSVNASTTVPTVAAPQVFPATVVWPSPMMTAPALPSAGSQIGASFPVRSDGGAVSAPAANDPFATLVQPSQAPLIPARRISPNNPFTGTPTRPDPFAEFSVLSGAPSGGTVQSHQPGKKTDKKDFFQEPPKPSLFDLSQQMQHQQLLQAQVQAAEPVKDLFGSTPVSSELMCSKANRFTRRSGPYLFGGNCKFCGMKFCHYTI
jgi:hypothetical protein